MGGRSVAHESFAHLQDIGFPLNSLGHVDLNTYIFVTPIFLLLTENRVQGLLTSWPMLWLWSDSSALLLGALDAWLSQ